MRISPIAIALAAAAMTVGAPAAHGDVSAPAAKQVYATTSTDIGTLMDDKAAWAVVIKHIPELGKDDQIMMARAMTLRSVQAFAAEQITDARLAAIDAELAALK